MDDTLIANINSCVKQDDEIWHLGDVIFGHVDNLPYIFDRIVCKNWRLVAHGNHDHKLISRGYDKTHFLSSEKYSEVRHRGILICMFHYPIGSWNEIGRGSIQLHGHCHGNYSRTIGRQMDVGVDVTSFKPLLLDDIVDAMVKVPVQTCDHHSDKTSYH